MTARLRPTWPRLLLSLALLLPACAPDPGQGGPGSRSEPEASAAEVPADSNFLVYRAPFPPGFPAERFTRISRSVYRTPKADCTRRDKDSDTAKLVAYPVGGVLVHTLGHRVEVPAGAIVSDSVVITLFEKAHPKHLKLEIEDEPKDTKYAIPITITINYKVRCPAYGTGGTSEQIGTHIARDNGGNDDYLGDNEDKTAHTVSGPADKLSTYVLGVP